MQLFLMYSTYFVAQGKLGKLNCPMTKVVNECMWELED